MEISKEDKLELQKLEESLWIAETRFDNDYMRSILSENFFEFGRSGKIYSIEDSLSAPMQEINIKLPLENLEFHPVSDTVVLVTYVSKVQYKDLEIGNRSSLWLRTSDGWKLQFHQGTPTFEK
jgi:hypothetical protein